MSKYQSCLLGLVMSELYTSKEIEEFNDMEEKDDL